MYKTIYDYCKLNDILCTRSQRALHNSNLLELCEDHDVPVEKSEISIIGLVNSYPVAILDEYFAA